MDIKQSKLKMHAKIITTNNLFNFMETTKLFIFSGTHLYFSTCDAIISLTLSLRFTSIEAYFCLHWVNGIL